MVKRYTLAQARAKLNRRTKKAVSLNLAKIVGVGTPAAIALINSPRGTNMSPLGFVGKALRQGISLETRGNDLSAAVNAIGKNLAENAGMAIGVPLATAMLSKTLGRWAPSAGIQGVVNVKAF